MKIEQDSNGIVISNEYGSKIHVTTTYEGIVVKNVSDHTAVHKKKGDRDTFLFTDAKGIQSWQNYDLLIGDSFV
jgi:hypothetical protein